MHRLAVWILVTLLGCTSVTDSHLADDEMARLGGEVTAGLDDEGTARLGEEFTLRVGETAAVHSIEGHPFEVWVRFLGVIEDSRCPAQWRCVVQGNAKAEIEIALASGGVVGEFRKDTLIVTTSDGPAAEPDIVILDVFELRMTGLDPYPETPGSIRPDEYAATFVMYFTDEFAQKCMTSTVPCYP